MRVNFRKGDIVRDTIEESDRWVGLVVGTRERVAEVYYPQYSGRIWLPFDCLERMETVQEVAAFVMPE